jgi:hypothetical protein
MNLLLFDYTNWRDEDHSYLIVVESVGVGITDRDRGELVINGHVILRDGMVRTDSGNKRQLMRRTFIASKIRNPLDLRT